MLKCGLSVAEFWELTPRETSAWLAAAEWRLKREQERDKALAWTIVALDRSKRLPSLAQLLQPHRRRTTARGNLDARAREFAELKERMQRKKGDQVSEDG